MSCDATYAIERGDTAFSAAFKRMLPRSIAVGQRRDELKDITLKQYLADLDRRLNRIMATGLIGEQGRKLRKRIVANRANLFMFITSWGVPYTNNVSERHLRPRVIFHKVTNGLPLRVGRRNLRRLPFPRQHRKGQPGVGAQRSPARTDRNTTRPATRRVGVSNHNPYGNPT
jgi:hypothetical protein